MNANSSDRSSQSASKQEGGEPSDALAHELYAMAQGPQPIEDAVRAIAARLALSDAQLLAAEVERLRADSVRLDWIVRQADEFSCGLIADAPGDGDYIVHGMDGYGQGKTAREAIDNAMRFNDAALDASRLALKEET